MRIALEKLNIKTQAGLIYKFSLAFIKLLSFFLLFLFYLKLKNYFYDIKLSLYVLIYKSSITIIKSNASTIDDRHADIKSHRQVQHIHPSIKQQRRGLYSATPQSLPHPNMRKILAFSSPHRTFLCP